MGVEVKLDHGPWLSRQASPVLAFKSLTNSRPEHLPAVIAMLDLVVSP